MSDLEAKAGAVLNWAPHAIPVPAEKRASCDRWGAGAGVPGAGAAPPPKKSKKKKRDETPEERKARKKAKKAKKAARE